LLYDDKAGFMKNRPVAFMDMVLKLEVIRKKEQIKNNSFNCCTFFRGWEKGSFWK